MVDRFSSYKDLKMEMVENHDYRVDFSEKTRSSILIIAPHAGKIEVGTSELTRAIAGEEFSYYLFEGLRRANNRDLHITSHRFDEPNALALVQRTDTIIGVHGRRDAGDGMTTYIGGLDTQLVGAIERKLKRSGFLARTNGHRFLATNPMNICNRGSSGKGAQIELPRSLRRNLLDSPENLARYASAIRHAANR